MKIYDDCSACLLRLYAGRLELSLIAPFSVLITVAAENRQQLKPPPPMRCATVPQLRDDFDFLTLKSNLLHLMEL